MTGSKLGVFIAAAGSLAWSGIVWVVHFPEDLIGEPAVDAQAFTSVMALAAPLLSIWLLALVVSVAAAGKRRHRDLELQLKTLRAAGAGRDDGPSLIASSGAGKAELVDKAQFSVTKTADRPAADGKTHDTQGETAGIRRGMGVSNTVFIRACNFAEHENDTEGFAALDAAAEDPEIEKFLRTAMDALQRLADFGVIVDNLPVEFADPDSWRAFAETGIESQLQTLGEVGTERDERKVSQKLKQKAEHRSLAVGFGTRAADIVRRFVPVASDAEILAFADTRSVRACILLQNSMSGD